MRADGAVAFLDVFCFRREAAVRDESEGYVAAVAGPSVFLWGIHLGI